jgi:hypothetical protein
VGKALAFVFSGFLLFEEEDEEGEEEPDFIRKRAVTAAGDSVNMWRRGVAIRSDSSWTNIATSSLARTLSGEGSQMTRAPMRRIANLLSYPPLESPESQPDAFKRALFLIGLAVENFISVRFIGLFSCGRRRAWSEIPQRQNRTNRKTERNGKVKQVVVS